MSMNKICVDPITSKELMNLIADNFKEVAEELLDDVGHMTLENMDWLDLAELFYTNGYMNGAMDATKSEDLRDTISLMNEEIEYQKQHSN